MADTQNGQPDLTAERLKRCEPLAKEMLQKLLDEKLLLTDPSFIERIVREQFENLFKFIVFQHLNDVFTLVQQSLEHAVRAAHNAQWGKNPDEVTVKDIDVVLKKAAINESKQKEDSLRDAQDKEKRTL